MAEQKRIRFDSKRRISTISFGRHVLNWRFEENLKFLQKQATTSGESVNLVAANIKEKSWKNVRSVFPMFKIFSGEVCVLKVFLS